MAEKAEECIQEPCNCPEAGAPKWIVTFGDMMSLLLCFFVLLLSFSTTEVVKFKQAAGSLKEAFGMMKTDPDHQMPQGDKMIATQVDLPPALMALVAIRAKAQKLTKNHAKLEMESGADWMRVKVPGDTLFDSGQTELKPEAHPLLDAIGDLINEYQGQVLIEGHTDNALPRSGEAMANYQLGANRAISVMQYLIVHNSIDKKNLVPMSFADTKPRETNALEEGRARNRRVEFVFTSGKKMEFQNKEGMTVIRPE
jgi:chemotaxis protein MotB